MKIDVKKLVAPVMALTLVAGLSGCANMTHGQRQAVGTVAGGVAGGVLGSALTNGSAIGTIGGAAGGAYLGHAFSN